jgi:hypothetical protein
MYIVKETFFLAFVLLSLLVIPCTVTGASATKGWVRSDNGAFVPCTVDDPVCTKICGDHKCAPFENTNKSLQDKLKQNQSFHVAIELKQK